jgi:hypothetical protein
MAWATVFAVMTKFAALDVEGVAPIPRFGLDLIRGDEEELACGSMNFWMNHGPPHSHFYALTGNPFHCVSDYASGNSR